MRRTVAAALNARILALQREASARPAGCGGHR